MKQKNTRVCYKCPDRKLHCHSQCDKYKELRAYYEVVRKERSRANDLHDYTVRNAVNNLSGRWF